MSNLLGHFWQWQSGRREVSSVYLDSHHKGRVTYTIHSALQSIVNSTHTCCSPQMGWVSEQTLYVWVCTRLSLSVRTWLHKTGRGSATSIKYKMLIQLFKHAPNLIVRPNKIKIEMEKNDNDSGMDSNLTWRMVCYVHGWVVVFKTELLGMLACCVTL